MKIIILDFKVIERYVMRDTYWKKFWDWLFGVPEPDQYHFDVVMKVDDPLPNCRPLRKDDFVQLDNNVKLQIWSVDRGNIIRAKTYKFVQQDLRKLKPKEAYLIYSRVQK